MGSSGGSASSSGSCPQRSSAWSRVSRGALPCRAAWRTPGGSLATRSRPPWLPWAWCRSPCGRVRYRGTSSGGHTPRLSACAAAVGGRGSILRRAAAVPGEPRPLRCGRSGTSASRRSMNGRCWPPAFPWQGRVCSSGKWGTCCTGMAWSSAWPSGAATAPGLRTATARHGMRDFGLRIRGPLRKTVGCARPSSESASTAQCPTAGATIAAAAGGDVARPWQWLRSPRRFGGWRAGRSAPFAPPESMTRPWASRGKDRGRPSRS